MIGIISHYSPSWQEMADLTETTLQKYADRHGYHCVIKCIPFNNSGRTYGLERFPILLEEMKKHPEIEWWWVVGCDCLITNFNVKLESILENISPEKHFIVCKDDHGISADVAFYRNTPEGREYIRHLNDDLHWTGTEQGHMWDDERNPKWRSITEYLPQQVMNSYDLRWYPHKYNNKCKMGGRIGWVPGDFVLQAVTGGQFPDRPGLDNYLWKLEVLKMHESVIEY